MPMTSVPTNVSARSSQGPLGAAPRPPPPAAHGPLFAAEIRGLVGPAARAAALRLAAGNERARRKVPWVSSCVS